MEETSFKSHLSISSSFCRLSTLPLTPSVSTTAPSPTTSRRCPRLPPLTRASSHVSCRRRKLSLDSAARQRHEL
ncbi:hypothetical protein L484_003084 [Morus notabilis]|uniref:Uncharacterized protein n=1 Tax=Morus notabilis TaxID=981085 RepID=W9SJ03_9ROSA|nr:hypothetical protein L484_003084 [Morus notabilis]